MQPSRETRPVAPPCGCSHTQTPQAASGTPLSASQGAKDDRGFARQPEQPGPSRSVTTRNPQWRHTLRFSRALRFRSLISSGVSFGAFFRAARISGRWHRPYFQRDWLALRPFRLSPFSQVPNHQKPPHPLGMDAHVRVHTGKPREEQKKAHGRDSRLVEQTGNPKWRPKTSCPDGRFKTEPLVHVYFFQLRLRYVCRAPRLRPQSHLVHALCAVL